MKKTLSITASILMATAQASAADLQVDLHKTTTAGLGEKAGTVTISSQDGGANFAVYLKGLEPNSVHGFHIHANGSCDPKEKNGKIVPALAAGGHWDPEETGKHEGPTGNGHLGDLPSIKANGEGHIDVTVSAPRIHDISTLKGHAVMVHAGGDNYSDHPKKLGGGGARMLCGVVQ